MNFDDSKVGREKNNISHVTIIQFKGFCSAQNQDPIFILDILCKIIIEAFKSFETNDNSKNNKERKSLNNTLSSNSLESIDISRQEIFIRNAFIKIFYSELDEEGDNLSLSSTASSNA